MYVKVIGKKNKNAKNNKKMEKTSKENERFHKSSLTTPNIEKSYPQTIRENSNIQCFL